METRLAEIAARIQLAGHWEETREWRISTLMTSSIRPEVIRNRRWLRVDVRSGLELTCHAPTLERAIEYLGIFQHLAEDLFYSVGWPSWAAKERPKPEAGEMTP